jgi:5-methylcytosine-specific restriction endonuclease McrA
MRCHREGRIAAANVVHHVKPHRGDWRLFADPANWESLCKKCHDSAEQSVERRGYDKGVGEDGWPADARHPLNGEEK